MQFDELYREKILDHYRNPHHFQAGQLENYSILQEEENSACGDRIRLAIKVEKNKIQNIQFQGAGCSLCFASASMLTDIVNQKSLAEAQKISYDILEILNGESDPKSLSIYGDMVGFAAIIPYQNRMQCVMLAWQCLQHALKKIMCE